mmetsp:Transcript_20037/g.28567  ORF Transcript_20037/g.28567 Transcript_20037/m.28567 type:complete len:221 (+) Transcript_20037:1015-1677(+)
MRNSRSTTRLSRSDNHHPLPRRTTQLNFPLRPNQIKLITNTPLLEQNLPLLRIPSMQRIRNLLQILHIQLLQHIHLLQRLPKPHIPPHRPKRQNLPKRRLVNPPKTTSTHPILTHALGLTRITTTHTIRRRGAIIQQTQLPKTLPWLIRHPNTLPTAQFILDTTRSILGIIPYTPLLQNVKVITCISMVHDHLTRILDCVVFECIYHLFHFTFAHYFIVT